MANKLIDTPVESTPGNPGQHGGSGDCVYGGEPGYPTRTGGEGQMPEVTLDNIGSGKYNKTK